MSLNFAAIAPHPPIIVAGIGGPEDLEKASGTIVGMRKLTSAFNESDIDTLIVISPHGLVYPDRFNIGQMQKLFGTFASFSQPDIIVEAENNLEFVDLLGKKLDETAVPYDFYDNGGEFFELDHGAMVPLTFLKQNQESSFKVVPVTYSYLDRASHFLFGQAMRAAAKDYPGRVGILASGDLSHQLLQNSVGAAQRTEAGLCPAGKKFDRQIVADLKNNNVAKIMQYDQEWLETIGECGYRSILILLGALDGLDITPEILSYEGPFGVGYLVANFKLPEA